MISEAKNLNSIREVINWLSSVQYVQHSELKKLLLPFDYFPGVLIDALNEKAISLFGEIVVEDVGDQYNISQEMLSELLSSIDEIDSLSKFLDLSIIERSNNSGEAVVNPNSSPDLNLMQPIVASSTAGDDTYEEALNYYVPYGKYPQNEKEALRLFKKAASLGCLDAYIDIANIFIDGGAFGDDSKFASNYEKAVECYIAGANKGSIYCYYQMGILYAMYLNDEVNARKCFLLYADKFKQKAINRNLIISNENTNTIVAFTISAIYEKLRDDHKNLASPIYRRLMVEFSPVVGKEIIESLEEQIAKGNTGAVAALQYFEGFASNPQC